MYINASEEFANIIADSGRTFKAKLVNGANVIKDVRSICLYQEVSEDTLSIGGGIANYMECVIGNTDLKIEGVEYEVHIGLKLSDGSYEYVPIGLYTPKKPKVMTETTSFVAFDRMAVKFAGAYFSDIEEYPVDAKNILAEIESQTGVVIHIDSLPDGVMVDQREVYEESETTEEGNVEEKITYEKPFTGYTYQEAIYYIAQLYGKNVSVNRMGELEFKWYEDTQLTFYSHQYKDDIEQSETEFVLGMIQCSVNQNTIISGAGSMGIAIENPVMTQERLDIVYQELSGYKCRGISLTIIGDIRIDKGDVIHIIKDDEDISIPVMKVETIYDGGISQKIYCNVSTGEPEEKKGPTAQRIDRLYNELLFVKEIVASKVSVDNLSAKVAALGYASVDELAAEVAKMGYMTAKQADLKYADIKLANVEKATVGTLLAGVGLISSATIKEGHVTGYLSSVEINANSITAGTLSVERLIIRGSEESLVYQLNNIDEATQELSVDKLNGEILTDRSITADKIVAKAITANEIATNAITAEKIISKAITVEKLDIESIFADEAVIEKLFAQNIVASGKITANDMHITGGSIEIQASDNETSIMQIYSGEDARIQFYPNRIYSYSNGEYFDYSSELIESYTKNSSGAITYRYRLDENDCICENTGYSFSDLYSKLENYITSSYLTTKLSSYVTTSALNTKLESYVTTSVLTTKLASYPTNSDVQVYVLGKFEDYILDGTDSKSATNSGLTVKVRKYGKLANVTISGTTSAVLNTSGAYVTLATVSNYGLRAFTKRIVCGSNYKGVLSITSAGAIRLGQTTLITTNGATTLPSGIAINVDETFILD